MSLRAKKSNIRQLARPGLLVILVAVITIEATALIQYYYYFKGIRAEAVMRAESQLETTHIRIMDVVDQAEAAVRNSIWIARWCLDVRDSLQVVARRVVQDNPVVVGSTVAVVPGYYSDEPLFSPYVCRNGDGVITKTLATPEYNYPAQEWFTKPLELGEGYWSEPYVDEGGGDILMTTYSVPLKDYRGKTAAVLTADVSLEWLQHLVNGMQVYKNAYGIIVSREGKVMIGPEKEFAKDEKVQTYTTQVERTGWTMSIVIPEKEIYGGLNRMALLVTFLQVLGVGMLVLILRIVAKHQLKFQQVKEKELSIENELQIASTIQRGMLPHLFPTYPDRKDVQIYASLTPAKDVGGDLFDFYIRDEQLFFCIGDVSGKGVPASLFMSVTRSIFRSVSARESMPDRIVTAMNEIMSDMNQTNMFVTLFVGVLNLQTGHLYYCNAGHDAPLLAGAGVGLLPCDSNIPVGVMPTWKYSLQEALIYTGTAIFLFTDGLTEAENAEQAQFQMERVTQVAEQALANKQLQPRQLIGLMTDAVHSFVGDAEQSDDLTMMVIQYIHQPEDTQPA